ARQRHAARYARVCRRQRAGERINRGKRWIDRCNGDKRAPKFIGDYDGDALTGEFYTSREGPGGSLRSARRTETEQTHFCRRPFHNEHAVILNEVKDLTEAD